MLEVISDYIMVGYQLQAAYYMENLEDIFPIANWNYRIVLIYLIFPIYSEGFRAISQNGFGGLQIWFDG